MRKFFKIMINVFLLIALAVSVAYALLLAFAYFFADALIFRPPPPTYVFNGSFANSEIADSSEEVKIKMEGQGELAGIFLEKKNSPYCILYSHGNGEDLGMIKALLESYVENLGVSVFSYDYFGYGQTGGKPTRENLISSSEAAWEFLIREKKYDPKNIILVGYSLGSVPSTHLAECHSQARGVILIGGIAKGVLTILPFNIVPWEILNNLKKWENIKIPLLVIHGTWDAIVPIRNGKKVFEAAKTPKRALWLKSCGHLDVHEFAPKIYFEEIENFIKNPNYEKNSSISF